MKKKYKFDDLAVCKTIRELKQIPGLVRQKLIAEVIDVANGVFSEMENGTKARTRLLRMRKEPSTMYSLYWRHMPSGSTIWNAVYCCEHGSKWPW